jgi:guanine nucleotide-binding protein subunit alpha
VLNPYIHAHFNSFADFQLTYAKREWSEERASWRAVIFLNFVRNVNEVLEHMTAEMADLPYPRYPENDSTEDLSIRPVKTLPPLKFKEKHKQLRLRLAPLHQVQRELEQQLGAASSEIQSAISTHVAPFEPPTPSRRRPPNEFSINSSNGWKSALDKFRKGPGNRPEAPNGTNKVSKDVEEEIAEIIASCREDIKSLWEDPIIKEVLNRRKAKIEDAPGLCVYSSSCSGSVH